MIEGVIKVTLFNLLMHEPQILPQHDLCVSSVLFPGFFPLAVFETKDEDAVKLFGYISTSVDGMALSKEAH